MYYAVTDSVTGKTRVYEREDLLALYYNQADVKECLEQSMLSFVFYIAIRKKKYISLLFELL